MSIEETPPFKPNDIIYPTAHDVQTVNCILIRFLKEVSPLVSRPSLTWTMEHVPFTTTFASGKKFTAEQMARCGIQRKGSPAASLRRSAAFAPNL
ncbi:hypothetical protein BDV24DRAFT_140019 [Aspergillus arachidicola]|uniref:Uncharacterized protein n=1 Tax=Aspergillus arachidicola TaxID=656916 RepID=A0A5N6XWB0_9EURO|nr:hypothetical protein BDV24DRAFT_140019 [Aspergillus arachidicola]